MILEVPAPRAACLPQPHHDPVAERAPCVRHPPSCNLVFSERKCTCVGCKGDWVFCLASDLDDWGCTCVSSCPALSLSGEIRHDSVCGSSLWCLKSVTKGSGKSMDLGRSKSFQGFVGMGRVSSYSTQPVTKQSIKFQTGGDFLGGRIARLVKHFRPGTCFLSR